MTEQEQGQEVAEDAGLVLDISEADLTLGDLVALEEGLGQPIPEEGMDTLPKTLVTVALALVALRREDPEATREDALAVKVQSLRQEDDGPGDGSDPTG